MHSLYASLNISGGFDRFNEVCEHESSQEGSWINKAVAIVKEARTSKCTRSQASSVFEKNSYSFTSYQTRAIVCQLDKYYFYKTDSETQICLEIFSSLDAFSNEEVNDFGKFYNENKEFIQLDKNKKILDNIIRCILKSQPVNNYREVFMVLCFNDLEVINAIKNYIENLAIRRREVFQELPNLGFTGTKSVEIAKLFPEITIKNIKETFKVCEEKDLYDLLTFRADYNVNTTLKEVSDYEITNKDYKEKVVLRLSKSVYFAQYYEQFGSVDDLLTFKAALIWADSLGGAAGVDSNVISSYKNFAISNNNFEFLIAKKLTLNVYYRDVEVDISMFTTLSFEQREEIFNLHVKKFSPNSPLLALKILKITDNKIISEVLKQDFEKSEFKIVLDALNIHQKLLEINVIEEVMIKLLNSGVEPVFILETLNITEKNLIFKILLLGAQKTPVNIHKYKDLLSFDENQRKEIYDKIVSCDPNLAFKISLDPSDPFKIAHLFHTDYFFSHVLKFAKRQMNLIDLKFFNFSNEKAFEVIKVIVFSHPAYYLNLVTNLSKEQEEELLLGLLEKFAIIVGEHAHKFVKISDQVKYEIALKSAKNGISLKNIYSLICSFDVNKKFEVCKLCALYGIHNLLLNLDSMQFDEEKKYEILLITSNKDPITTARQFKVDFINLKNRACILSSCIENNFMTAKYAKNFLQNASEMNDLLAYLRPEQRVYVEFVLIEERTNLMILNSALATGNYTDDILINVLRHIQPIDMDIGNSRSLAHEKLRFINNSETTDLLIAEYAITHNIPHLISKCSLTQEGALHKLTKLCLQYNSSQCFIELIRVFDTKSIVYEIAKYNLNLLNKSFFEDIKGELFIMGSLFSNHKIKSFMFEGTFVEKFFFDSNYCSLAIELVKYGEGVITKRMARLMILDCRSGLNPEYRDLLLSRNLATSADLEIIEIKDIETLDHKIISANRYLEEISRLYNLNPNRVDLKRIFDIKMLKKDARFLKDLVPKNEVESSLKTAYESLSSRYNTFIGKHLFLNELRLISKEIRKLSLQTIKFKAPSERLLKYFSLWSFDAEKRSIALEGIQKLFLSTRKEYWLSMAKRSIEAADKVETEKLLKKRIKWIHGTTSHALVGLVNMGALVPTGQLLREGNVPLTGEINGSHNNLNNAKLSGEVLTRSWCEALKMYLEACTRFQVSYLFASSENGFFKHGLRFNPEEALKWAESEIIGDNIKFIDSVFIQILRIRMTMPDAESRLLPLKKMIEEHPKLEEEDKIKVLEAFTFRLAYTYTPQELKAVLDSNPYPIIFASQTIDPVSHSPKYFKGEAEFVVENKQYFGKDIQIAFTDKDNIEALEAVLKPFGVQVFDLDMARYLETMSMIIGSQDIEVTKKFNIQSKINFILQRDVLREYASLFPKEPVYKNTNGEIIKLKNPDFGRAGLKYQSYLKAVKEGDILPRNVHGAMHATRTTIWSQLLLNLYSNIDLTKTGLRTDINPLALAIAAAYHDGARDDDGPDHWDIPSSEKFLHYVKSGNFDFPDVNKYVHALANKDPEDNKFTCLIQMIVHDADCLEIIRVLRSLDQFQKNRLAILQLEHLSDEQLNEIDLVILEVSKFIEMTESRDIKHKFEEESRDYYLDVILLMNSDEFPTLYRLLVKEISQAKEAKYYTLLVTN